MIDWLSAMSIAQWVATIIGFVYIFFAVKNNPIAFIFGLISSSFWAYESFANLNLAFDGVLQLYYIFMSIWGIWLWKYGGENRSELPIRELGIQKNILIVVIGICVSIMAAFYSVQVLNNVEPYLDAITTCFSIIATLLLVMRYVDNWVYWMIINPIYIFIYMRTSAYLFIVIMIVYTILAIVGYVNWRKLIS